MYNLNTVVYFLTGTQLIKGVVDERVKHDTQKGTVVKYFIRPYGLEKVYTIDAENVIATLEEGKVELIKRIMTDCTKEAFVKDYENALEKVGDAKNSLDNYDQIMKETIEKINAYTEELYDNREKEYQETKKEASNG